jgi:hypothetical protein
VGLEPRGSGSLPRPSGDVAVPWSGPSVPAAQVSLKLSAVPKVWASAGSVRRTNADLLLTFLMTRQVGAERCPVRSAPLMRRPWRYSISLMSALEPTGSPRGGR